MRVMTWFWRQHPNRAGYDAEKVNRWAEQVSQHLRIPHTLACVTDCPEGIDPSVEIIPLPRDFDGLKVRTWSEASGLPQCYRRLKLWAPDAAEYFGDTDLVSMDLDVLILRSIDHLFAEPPDFRMFKGTSKVRPYNGSMVRIRAGARPQVWEQFAADPIGVATKARELYIGSDQAVVSMILGAGEKVWSTTEGVHHYSSTMPARYAGAHRLPPPGMAMIFFPGHVKPWDPQARRVPWIDAGWRGTTTPAANVAPRLRAYRDPKGWGQRFAKAAQEKGRFVSLFTRPRMIPTGAAFVRLDQQGPQRDISRRVVADLNRQGVRTLPTAREALWYDDKGAQLEALERWMPRTVYFRSEPAARLWLTTSARFPLVSKSIDGSGSKGVRILRSAREARLELARAFTAPGIPSVYDRWQLGYVYWQDFIPDQPCDYRVCVVGPYLYGLVRSVRPGDFRASGSGLFRNITLADERERAACALAAEIAAALPTEWMAFDIVFDGDRPVVLEMSSAWTMRAYETAPCFMRNTLAPTGRTGADSFAIAVDIVERLACDPAAAR
jgi:glutathione synthase/RimK-type ligase-like ATP-grasp enzyme